MVWASFDFHYFSDCNSDCRSFDGIIAADFFGGDGSKYINLLDLGQERVAQE